MSEHDHLSVEPSISVVPTIDVIVVAWNRQRFMQALFEGLRRVDYPRESFTVHIVDNASSDGTADEVRRLMNADGLPHIVLHENKANLGFAGGNNVILRSTTADYAFLLNPDAAFESSTLREVIAVAETHPTAGSVQPLLVLAERPDTINSIGNDIHFAGFGYCRGYGDPVSSAPTDVTPIAYASGASVLLRVSALRHVGLFDETLFAYHEDLDLGWRIFLAGYENLLAPKSVVRHHYEFSRSIQKWYWMERNRGIVLVKNYRLGTVALMLPALLVISCATWLFAIRGGWAKEKWRASTWFLVPSSWSYLWRARRDVQRLRKRSDREILQRFVSAITYQEVSSPFIEKIANPLMAAYLAIVRSV